MSTTLTPKLSEALVQTPDKIILIFDQPLDTSIATPTECFQVNYGKILITSFSYEDTNNISLAIDPANLIKSGDKIFISYTPPVDETLALAHPTVVGTPESELRKARVRPIYKFNVKNLIQFTETLDSNLGNFIGGGAYPRSDRVQNPRAATVDDFILAFGMKEAIQITNMDDASATEPNIARLEMALADANAMIDSYIAQATRAGKVLVSSNRRRTALIIARYYLDSVRRREDVAKDYELAIKELDISTQVEQTVRPDDDLAINSPRGIIRTHRIPQRYNGKTGKGFSGWWTDPAADRARDWRYNRLGAENNNNEPNSRPSGNPSTGSPYENDQPNEGGGTQMPDTQV